MVKKIIVLFLFITVFILSFGLSGCENGGEGLTVAVTIAPEAAFVRAVGGSLVNIVTLVPPGYSPESYEPSAKAMVEFSKAAVFFSIGVPSELSLKTQNVNRIALDKKAAEVYPERFFGEERDPHIWLSPKRAIVMVEAVAAELSRLDPENAGTYTQNAEAYIASLNALDAEIKDIFSDASDKKFIVFHPAFGYFADDYGLSMYALQEEGKDPDPARIMELIDLAKESGITTVFYQQEETGAQFEAFIDEIGGTGVALNPLSEDYINNMKNMANAMRGAMK